MALSVREFMDLEPPPIPYLVGRGVLPVRGKLILGAPPKANKSFIAINMGLALAEGRPLFNAVYKSGTPVFPVIKPCRVLYIEQELGQTGLKQRLAGILLENRPENFFIKTRDTALRLDTEPGIAVIRGEVAQVKPDVVIFDPLAKFHLEDENSAQGMGFVMRNLDHLIQDFGTAVIVIHHTKKPNDEYPSRGGDRLRGSSAVFADVDSLMEIERLSGESVKEPILKLGFELRHGEPIEPVFLTRLGTGEVCYCGENYIWGGTGTAKSRGDSRFRRV